MEKEKVRVLYDENGRAIRVQMDFDVYEWLITQVPMPEQAFAAAR